MPEFEHADADADDAYAEGDIPIDEIDPTELDTVQRLVDDVNNPGTPTSALDALRRLYGDDLEVPD